MSSLISRVRRVVDDNAEFVVIKVKVPNELDMVGLISELEELVRKYNVEVEVEGE